MNKKNKINPSLIFTVWLAIFCFAVQADAAIFTVNQAGDAGDGICDATCTLRDAVTEVNGNGIPDTINFAAGITNIVLNNEIVIANNGSLTINGSGANVLTIDGGAGTNRIFFINQDAVVTITDVTLTGGNGAGASNNNDGGAIFADRCRLILDRVHVTGNTAFSGYGGGVNFFGGSAAGGHEIRNSTFSNNSVGNSQGALSGGAFYAIFCSVNVSNSTFSGNSATADGGAFYVTGAGVTLRSVTVTQNSANGCGGIDNASGGTLDFGNTIIAQNNLFSNQPGGTTDICSGGTTISSGFNLVGNANNTVNTITYQNTDILNADPQLGSLQLNPPGTTPTHALLLSSPAIDKGNSFGFNTDQRGTPRPVQNNSIPDAQGGDASDIGAYESQATTAAKVSISGRVLMGKKGIGNVRLLLTNFMGETRIVFSNPFGYYRFNNVESGQNYILTVTAKRYRFENPTQVLSVGEDLNELNFYVSPQTMWRKEVLK